MRWPDTVNGRGFSTRMGGSRLAPPVLDAMRAAGERFVEMEDLQGEASRAIAEATGAEAGHVTSGAAAALTLAAAACIAGFDVAAMDRLPDTAGMRHEIVIQRRHRNDYDHALRLAGARLVECGFADSVLPHEVDAAVGPRTCAIFYLGRDPGAGCSLEQTVAIARRHGLPVIVDGADALPPAANLRRFVAAGAGLVCVSGGKHIGGPSASGILCGRRDLVLSAALQNLDMDVFPETWPWRGLIEEGVVPGPPRHGVGRGFKAGKEEIAGLVEALRLYAARDFDAEYAEWARRVDAVVAGLEGVPGVRARRVEGAPGAAPVVPRAHVAIDADAGLDAVGLVERLRHGDPVVCVQERLAAAGTIVVAPQHLDGDGPHVLARRVREIVREARGRETPGQTPGQEAT